MASATGYLDALVRRANSQLLTERETDGICSELVGFFSEIDAVPLTHSGRQQLYALLIQPQVHDRRALASVMIRLLASRHFIFLINTEWRRPLIELIEAEFGNDIYQEFSTVRNRQAHSKLEIFSRQIDFIERDFNNALCQLTSLGAMESQQRALMTVLSRSFGALVIIPFLPSNILAELREVYRLVSAYRAHSSDSTRVVEAFREAFDSLEQLEETLDAFGTEYSHLLAREVATKLRNLIERDLAKNPAVQKSNLKLEFRKKKYQFHNIGLPLKVAFTVTNEGPGFAYDIRIQAVCGNGIEVIAVPETNLARLLPNEAHAFELTVRPLEKRSSYEFMLEGRWRDFKGTEATTETSEEIRPQRNDIDWVGLRSTDPYSLEPVTKERDLVGRTDVLGRLIGTLRSPSVGSAIIRGQKRVGKTSIARVLQGTLPESEFLSFYIESGDYKNPSGIETIRLLGDRIVREICARDSRAGRLTAPVFKGALAPLAEFVDSALSVITDRSLVIFIDEFDQLPTELYSRGPLGDSFFLTLRSVTSRPRVGFVFIGGERISYILASQGQQVNKWDVIGLDYFSREDHWSDFRELVQRPTLDVLEFSEGAFVRAHEVTAGNPYFTKLICQSIFRSAVDRRDAHITEVEVEKSIEATAREVAENTFAHFWDDGLLVDGDAALQKSIIRRKVLIAVAEARRDATGAVSIEDIQQSRFLAEVVQIEGEVRELVAREILVESSDRRYQFKVDLFGRWLRRRGVKDILLTFGNMSALLVSKAEERIDTEALASVVLAWPAFRGKKVAPEDVRRWLSQFGGTQEQFAMLRVVHGLTFPTSREIDETIRSIHAKIVKVMVREENVIRQVAKDRRKESEIVVVPACTNSCELGFARRYVDCAEIYVRNIIPKQELINDGKINDPVKAIILLKTIVSSYDRSWEVLEELAKASGRIPIFLVALIGMDDGIRRLQERVAASGMNARIFTGTDLREKEESCFGEQSKFYYDAEQRDFGRNVAETFSLLMGKGDLDVNIFGSFAITFPFGCPHETLAVLRASIVRPGWEALFDSE